MKCIVIISNEGESMCVCVCGGWGGGAGGKWGGDRRQRWRFSKGDLEAAVYQGDRLR